MRWDIDLPIAAPAPTIFEILSGWYRNRRLRKLSSAKKYHLLSVNGGTEYFWLEVRDIPFKVTHCYGKRLLRSPDAVVTIFTYRFMRSKELIDPTKIEQMMQRDWEAFFYHTVRIFPVGPCSSRLVAAEPTGNPANGTPLNEISAFYIEIKRMAEAVATGVASSNWMDDNGYAAKDAGLFSTEDDAYDPYTVLGVSRFAGLEEIKRVYRSLAMKWHPDTMAGRGGAAKEYAHNQFIEIATAYHSIIRSRDK